MAKKKHRKTIRMHGKPITERFSSKEQAELWYHSMYSAKKFSKYGLATPVDHKVTLKKFFDEDWIVSRKKEHGPATTDSDEQRFRDYLEKTLGHFPLSVINSQMVRGVLMNLVSPKTGKSLSPATRNRVRALISEIFNDAINRDKPLAGQNPTFGLKFSGKRFGKKKPSHLSTSEACLAFVKAAKEISLLSLVYASIMLMTGLRKQELIGLCWDCVDFEAGTIEIKRKFIQATKEVVLGTKAGVEQSRFAPMNKDLAKVLRLWKSTTKRNKPGDFVLSNEDGSFWTPGQIRTIHTHICIKAGVVVTVHGLRHSFGREFAQKSKNLKALQDILGHSNFTTTQLYSELGKDRLKSFQDVVSFDLGFGEDETEDDE